MSIETVRRNALRALLPPADLPLSQWVEDTVFIPSSASATPGRMRLWSYQRGILDAVDDPEIERITAGKGARVGFTALGNAIVASFVAVQPSPVLYIQPTADDARDSSVEFESMMEASPALRGLMSDEADEAGRSTMMARRFAGGSLKFLAAKAPRTLRRHSARVVFGDEIDAWEVSAEGSPIELATMRTLTFSNRKLIFGGTPIFDHGAVTTLYSQSDQRVFELPCPECGDFHEIAWQDIRWPDGKPEEAHWVCPSCGSVVHERHKPRMVQEGRWRAIAQGQRSHAGFRVNTALSRLTLTLLGASWRLSS
ncbi:phage terminase large subunit family protein [Pseudogemmobacter bohemicus]|uniref:phage terminase large subunit family protein n=1 Tax=Pseudogemmobacter bohemicus TaxID=2250708 RepID=UPI000DD44B19|nr:phage terminase large subunit family protein [Pseudogemmobacter bohemicus]